MKRLCCVILHTLIFCTATGQSGIDSLQGQLALSKPDTSRVSILSRLSLAYVASNHELSLKYAQEGLALARKLRFPIGEADCLRRSGIVFYIQGRYPEALDIFQTALSISEKINHSFGIAAGLGHLGNIYFEQGEYSKALSNYYRYLSIAEDMQNDHEQANALRNIGKSYLRQNHLDSALYYYDRMDQLIKGKEYGRLNAVFYSDYGQLQAQLGNKRQAIASYRKSIGYQPSSDAYLGIANLYHFEGQSDSSIFYAQLALKSAEKNNYHKGIVAASKLLSEIYEGTNDQLAFEFLKRATAVNDSLFNTQKTAQVQNLFFLEEQRRKAAETARSEYRNQLQLYVLLSALGVFFLLAIILYRNNRNKQKANLLLQNQKLEINQQRTKAEEALEELKGAQTQLIQSEKMASLGELTAGIAHEIQNPLNFVNNFAEVNSELVAEMREEIEKGNISQAKLIAADIQENEQKIIDHGKRAAGIVKGMLQHSRTSTGVKEPTDLNQLADEYLRLAFHGFKAKDKTFNATLETNYDRELGLVNIIPQDIGRVILNLITNSFYAVTEKKMHNVQDYEPKISVSTKRLPDKIIISVRDNGIGVPSKVLDRIFQPFFTTKPTGRGTGLGLSLSYDIIKSHGGELTVKTREGEFAEFIIELPS